MAGVGGDARMHDYELYMLVAKATWVAFLFAFGACAGSLTNVLVYRLPRGLDVVTPPSKCPACETRLTWRENIPVLGWLLLRGRCRFCRSPISAEYPLVEAFVGLLLAGTFVLFYLVPNGATVLDIAVGSIKPEWAAADGFDSWPRTTWPIFVVFAFLLCSLVAMTLVDAKTFTIPLVLPWAATIVAVVFHIGYAIYLSATGGSLRQTAPGWIWSLPTPGGNAPHTASSWWWIGASICGLLGLGVGLLLIKFKLITRSFDDYAAWEEQTLKQRGQAKVATDPDVEPSNGSDAEPVTTPTPLPMIETGELRPTDPRRAPPRFFGPVTVFVATILVATALGWVLGPALGIAKWWGLLVGFLLAPVGAGMAYRRVTPPPVAEPEQTDAAGSHAGPSAGGPDMWIEYPHARREMLRELAYLAPCVLLGIAGGTLAANLWTGITPPLWLLVLSGVFMGYLISGGLVWAVRIAGSLAFGREAMGLGDVHLMAAVGACLGWIDGAVAFPLAAVVGLYWALAGAVSGGRLARAMPFGPYLAVASIAVIFAKPLIEIGLTNLLAIPPGEPVVNLP